MHSMLPGDRLDELVISDLTLDGLAVARCRGQVVFVDKGLPGAVVSATVVKVKKGLVHAEATHELRPSPHQIEPWCPHFPLCGGCARQNLAPDAARALKTRQVRETLRRIGKITEAPVADMVPSPLERGFRNKMSYAFGQGPEDGALVLGLRQSGSHALVPVRSCGLQAPVAMSIVEATRRFAERAGLRPFVRLTAGKHQGGRGPAKGRQGGAAPRHEGYLRFLVVRTPDYVPPDGKPQVLVECITGPDHRRTTGRAPGSLPSGEPMRSMPNGEAIRLLGHTLMETCGLRGFVHSERRQADAVAQGEGAVFRLGDDFFEERLGGHVLRVPYNAFLQTNTGAAERLYALIRQESGLSGRETLWDVYSGVGGIAFTLADQAKEVHGFEAQPEAVLTASANAERLGLAHCRFHVWDMEHSPPGDIPPPDSIVADPPRAGLSANFKRFLLHCPARRFLYVSCDPATQARDAAELADAWRAVKALPVDMFPWTPHVETLLVFDRRSA